MQGVIHVHQNLVAGFDDDDVVVAIRDVSNRASFGQLVLLPADCFGNIGKTEALNELFGPTEPGIRIEHSRRFVRQAAQGLWMKVIFVPVRDGDDVGGLDDLRINRLRKDVPLLTVSWPGKPGVRGNAHVTRVNQQTSVGYVFNSHEWGFATGKNS